MGEGRDREGDCDQRGRKSHWDNWEDKEKRGRLVTVDRTARTPLTMTEGRRVLRRCLGQKLSSGSLRPYGDMQEKMLC